MIIVIISGNCHMIYQYNHRKIHPISELIDLFHYFLLSILSLFAPLISMK